MSNTRSQLALVGVPAAGLVAGGVADGAVADGAGGGAAGATFVAVGVGTEGIVAKVGRVGSSKLGRSTGLVATGVVALVAGEAEL